MAPDSLLYMVHDTIFSLIETFIDECQKQKKPFILDNVIRSKEDLADLIALLAKKQVVPVVIHLIAPEAVLKERIKHRIVCPHCNALYNTLLTPLTDGALCSFCHMPLTVRQFDDERTITMRLNFYKTTVIPLMRHIKKNYQVFLQDSSGTLEECLAAYRRLMASV